MTAAEQRKLKEIKSRIVGLRADHGEAVKKNTFITLPIGTMVTEAEWLIKQLEKADVEETEDEPAEATA